MHMMPAASEADIMAFLTTTPAGPVTRIATFRFHPHVTPEQKADRASAFLGLYENHPELVLEKPRGGRPLDTPLELTGLKREMGWDLGFIVVFKVCLYCVNSFTCAG